MTTFLIAVNVKTSTSKQKEHKHSEIQYCDYKHIDADVFRQDLSHASWNTLDLSHNIIHFMNGRNTAKKHGEEDNYLQLRNNTMTLINKAKKPLLQPN